MMPKKFFACGFSLCMAVNASEQTDTNEKSKRRSFKLLPFSQKFQIIIAVFA